MDSFSCWCYGWLLAVGRYVAVTEANYVSGEYMTVSVEITEWVNVPAIVGSNEGVNEEYYVVVVDFLVRVIVL
jgi:hypothetical protein